jgi:hypothetical protein
MNRELNTLIFLFSVMGGVLGISCMLFFFSVMCSSLNNEEIIF